MNTVKISGYSRGLVIAEDGVFHPVTKNSDCVICNLEEIKEISVSDSTGDWSINRLVKNGTNNCNTGETRFVFRKYESGWKLAPVVGDCDTGYKPDRGTFQVYHPGDIILGCDFGHGDPRDWSNILPRMFEHKGGNLRATEVPFNPELIMLCLEALNEGQRNDLLVHNGRGGIWL